MYAAGFLAFVVGFAFGSVTFSITGAGEEVLFTVAYSSEKERWMEGIREPFVQWYQASFPGERVRVNFFPVGSRESIIAILNGQYKPAIWSPAASIWVPYMNYLYAQSGLGTGPITSTNKTIVYSPIVVASWESVVTEHGINSLQAMHDLAALEPSPIKLAHTDPRLSNSGFCAIVMAIAAAARKNSTDLVYADLLNSTIQSWVGQFESTAVQYGKSTGYLIKSMLQSGPAGITTAILYENLVIDWAREAKARWNQRIIAVYPDEGSIHSDHPFCILDGAPWMNPRLLEVSQRFLAFLDRQDVQEMATTFGFRLYNTSIPLPADTFNEENGVQPDLSGHVQMHVPRDPLFISKVSDVWLVNRPTF